MGNIESLQPPLRQASSDFEATAGTGRDARRQLHTLGQSIRVLMGNAQKAVVQFDIKPDGMGSWLHKIAGSHVAPACDTLAEITQGSQSANARRATETAGRVHEQLAAYGEVDGVNITLEIAALTTDLEFIQSHLQAIHDLGGHVLGLLDTADATVQKIMDGSLQTADAIDAYMHDIE